jgi:hypothetical protein
VTSTDSTTAYTGAQLMAALATTEQRIYTAAGDNGVDDVFLPFKALLPVLPERQYTAEDFSAMLNAAADGLETEGCEDSDTIWTDTVANLVVNIAGYLLGHPDAELDEIIAYAWADLGDDIDWPEQYDDTPDDQLPAKGTPAHTEAIVATVLGWVA